MKKILTSSQDILYSANTVRHRAAILDKCGQRKTYHFKSKLLTTPRSLSRCFHLAQSKKLNSWERIH